MEKSTRIVIMLYPFFFGILGYFIIRGGMLWLGTGLIIFAIAYAVINIGIRKL